MIDRPVDSVDAYAILTNLTICLSLVANDDDGCEITTNKQPTTVSRRRVELRVVRMIR
jgi:hypothetical protein